MIDTNQRRDADFAKLLAMVEADARAYAKKYPAPKPVVCPTTYLGNSGAADTPILGVNTVRGLR